MGSFNISCGISDLAIEPGDRVGVSLIQGMNNGSSGYSGAKLFDSDPTKFYRPRLPPIFARYNDYGSFTDVEESGLTRYLEDVFERPIQAVLNAVGDKRRLYESRSTVGALYMAPAIRKLLDDTAICFEDKLLGVGFVKEAEESGELEAYSFEGVRLSLHSYGHGLERWRAAQGDTLSFEHPAGGEIANLLSVFSEMTYHAPGFESSKQVLELRRYSGMAFLADTFTPMTEFVKTQRYYADRLKDTSEELDRFFTLELSPEFLEEVRTLEDSSPDAVAQLWTHRTRSRYIEDELRISWNSLESFRATAEAKDVIVGKELEFVLYMLNRRFQPTMVAEEWESDAAALALNKATDVIIRRRMYDRDEDLDETV